MPFSIVTSKRDASATRRSRTVCAAVSTALRAAASHDSLLVADHLGDAIHALAHDTLLESMQAGRPVRAILAHRQPRAKPGSVRPCPRLAPPSVRGVARHVRHAAPPRPGAGKDRAGARAGGARVPACGAPARRARLGDAAAAGAERERRGRARTRPAGARGGRRTSGGETAGCRSCRAARSARSRSTCSPPSARSRVRSRSSCAERGALDDPARRGRGARDLRRRAGRHATSTRRPRAELVLAELRAPHGGRKTPVNAWWGSFDLAVTLFGEEPSVSLGWWPGRRPTTRKPRSTPTRRPCSRAATGWTRSSASSCCRGTTWSGRPTRTLPRARSWPASRERAFGQAGA